MEGWRPVDATSALQYESPPFYLEGVWSLSGAAFAIQLTLTDKIMYLSVTRKAKEGFYVDDLLLSVSSENTSRLIHELRQILTADGFHHTKLITNKREVLDSVLVEERHSMIKQMDLCKCSMPIERALGMLGDLEKEHLTVRVQVQPLNNDEEGAPGSDELYLRPPWLGQPFCYSSEDDLAGRM